MGMFDFVTGDDFRKCLESDYAELTNAMNTGGWKTVHVLSGSVVEAVLIDYLVAVDYEKTTGRDPLKLDLAGAVKACVELTVLSEKTAALSTVVREYRNLIHPGRVIRLNETPTAASAKVACAVVDLVVNELAEKRRVTYGLTAEQVVAKVERDPSGSVVVEHLLREMNPTELRRLILTVIPTKYMAFCGEGFMTENEYDVSRALCTTFRAAIQMAGVETATVAAKRYITILKQESGWYVRSYENAFVQPWELVFLGPEDLALVKNHVLSRLNREVDSDVLHLVGGGFVTFLDKEDSHRWVDPLVKAAVMSRDEELREQAKGILIFSVNLTSSEQDMWISNRLEVWRKRFASKDNPQAEEVLVEIINCRIPDDDIPF